MNKVAQSGFTLAKTADRLFGLLISTTAVISAGTILIMCVLVAVNVIARQFFNSPFLDTVLLGSLSIVIMTYMGLAWVYRLGEHVSVQIFVQHFSWRRRLCIKLFFLALSFIALCVAVYETWTFAYAGLQMGERLRGMFTVNAFPFHVLMPIGFALLSIEVARSIVFGIAALVKDRPDLTVDEQRLGQSE